MKVHYILLMADPNIHSNQRINCAHQIDDRAFGIYLSHSYDNMPFSIEEQKTLIAGPIEAVEVEVRQRLNDMLDAMSS